MVVLFLGKTLGFHELNVLVATCFLVLLYQSTFLFPKGFLDIWYLNFCYRNSNSMSRTGTTVRTTLLYERVYLSIIVVMSRPTGKARHSIFVFVTPFISFFLFQAHIKGALLCGNLYSRFNTYQLVIFLSFNCVSEGSPGILFLLP